MADDDLAALVAAFAGLSSEVVGQVYREVGRDRVAAAELLRAMAGPPPTAVVGVEEVFGRMVEEFAGLDAGVVFGAVEAAVDGAGEVREELARRALLEMVADVADGTADTSDWRLARRLERKQEKQGRSRKATWEELKAGAVGTPAADKWLQQNESLALRIKCEQLMARYPTVPKVVMLWFLSECNESTALVESKLNQLFPHLDRSNSDCPVDSTSHVAENAEPCPTQVPRSSPPTAPTQGMPPRPPKHGNVKASPHPTYEPPDEVEFLLRRCRDARMVAQRTAQIVPSSRSTATARRVRESTEEARHLLDDAIALMMTDPRFHKAGTLDLHYFCVEDALKLVDAKVRATLLHTDFEVVEFVTGKGAGSREGPQLRPAVEEYARQHKFVAHLHHGGGAVLLDLRL
mmetsp:Transcript_17642/g.43351  ORF Transcript_17642/g.43351 Transcript_17642/m.43351 type:complete len:405 (+) Transcript_17642:47-1261(+)